MSLHAAFLAISMLAATASGCPSHAQTYQADEKDRFHVTAFVDNTPVWFQVDSGADVVVLSSHDAWAVGVHNKTRGVGKTKLADGSQISIVHFLIGEIRFGSIVIHDIEGLTIISKEDNVSLLGMNFLKRVPGGVHIEGQTLTFGKGKK